MNLSSNQINEDINSFHKELLEKFKLIIFNKLTPGQAIMLPKGKKMFNKLLNIIRNILINQKFQEISSPTFGIKKIWEKTKHTIKYMENMYNMCDNYFIKPMNCPMHMIIAEKMYMMKTILPLKLFELNYCFRRENSGSISGLFRLYRFTQDDTHNICNQKDIQNMIHNFIFATKFLYQKIGIKDIVFRLSETNKEYIGNNRQKEFSNNCLKEYLINNNIEFIISKDGAFYGPKIDVLINDNKNRVWQTGTIQIDLCTLKNIEFKLKDYHNYDNCVLIHAAILGTLERFIAISIEKLKKIPNILNPYKINILTVKNTEKTQNYIQKIKIELHESLKEEIDFNIEESDIKEKIKQSHELNYEYICCVGDIEADSDTINFYNHLTKEKDTIKLNIFLEKIKKQVYEEKYNY